jgi:hypothetical protein
LIALQKRRNAKLLCWPHQTIIGYTVLKPP